MTDVVVYGATACGVMAAVAAQRAGARTVLVEPGRHVGGMVSGGLSWTDVGDSRVLGGLCRRFYEAVASHYGASLWEVRGPEPHVAERLLGELLDGVDVRLGTDELPDAAVVVDAGYEGDVMAAAGVPFAVGRESTELYGERWAGRQPAYRPSRHNFSVVDRPRSRTTARCCPASGRPSSTSAAGRPSGSARATAASRPTRTASASRMREERLPIEPPEGYDEREFELLRRYLEADGRRDAGRPRPRPAPEREVRRQLDRPRLAERARRLQPRVSGRRPRGRAGASPPLHAGLPLLPRRARPPRRVGASRPTSSTAACRTSSTSARAGACSASTC